MMKAIKELKTKVEYLFTDIDDTLTDEGLLSSEAFKSLWKLHKKNVKLIPITGRPAGWCEMIARTWPVDGVIGENGAFYFRYNRVTKKMERDFFTSPEENHKNQKRLEIVKEEIFKLVPNAKLASDQFCRMMDLAIDFCEDIPRLSEDEIQSILSIFQKYGANVKLSSIHINGWFGDYDKLKMCEYFFKSVYQKNILDYQDAIVFSGDSPNDEPMFSFFKNSVGVKNVEDFLDQIKTKPKFICSYRGGKGFQELTDHLLLQL